MPHLRSRLVVVALLALSASPLAVESVRRAEFRDAFVSFDQASGKWIIGNDLIQYALRLTSQQTISVDGLSIGTTADPVTLSREPDSTITLDGQTWRLGERDSGFRVATVDPAAGSHFVSLSFRFVDRATTLAATRHYVVYPGVPVVEMWTEFESLDGARHSIRNLNGYTVAVPAGDVDYVLGLDTPVAEGGPFTQRTRQLAPDEHFEFGSTTLSSQQTLPYVSIGNGHRRVFGGLVWSGGWSASFDRRGDAIDFNLGLRDMSAWVGRDQRVEGPHAFLGATWDVPGADIAATTQFVRAGRAGRAFPALTTFNTWFVRGIRIDDETIRRDMDWAAEAGLELFQLDAGWYTHDGSPDIFNFTRGLGSWEVDAERFPRGLSELAEHARGRGLKFGIWVEPERVGIETVGRPGLAEERFLATQNGQYAPGRPNDEAEDAQICLAHPPARAWVLNRLTAFLDQVQPDNLKWDYNRWMHCTRADHDHPPDGGNFAHTQGLYQLLAALRERYPSLTIENCSQGGHRMDFAMARLTDTAWMDDRTAPSAHVRRNLQGLMRVFPPAYLFSYLMAHADEPIRGTEDLALMARSRMPGVVGVAADLGQVSEGEVNQIYQEVQLAKALRAFQENAVTYPLTPQRPGPGEWEVVQQFNLASRASLVFAFANEARDPIRVSLRGIQPDLTYELRSSDRGVLGRLNGADLIAGGLEIMEAPESGAQVLVLEPIISTAWPLQNSRLQFPVPRRSPTKPASSSRP